MNNSESVFFYSNRYNLSVKHAIEKYNNNFKSKLLNFLYRNRFTSEYLDGYDLFNLRRSFFKNVYSFDKDIKSINNESKQYKDIKLLELDYFEALEIDNFDKYRGRIISKFSNNEKFSSSSSRENLKQRLDEVKKEFDSISWGNLFSVNFEKKRRLNNNLIKKFDVSYIKTNESYFILKIKIKPSDEFKNIFQEIINSEDVNISKHHYNSYYNILKLRRFYFSESKFISSKCLSIENLLSDLNQQVKRNITKHFKGYFHNSKIDVAVPSIEYYEVNDFSKFHDDSALKKNFYTGSDGHYSTPDDQVEIYFSNYRKRSTRVQVVKQKGHGSTPQKGKDITDYDKIESYYLLNSLAFPCVFRGILIELFEKLNSLKREIYDFGNDTNNINIFKSLFLFNYNNSYLKLKQTLVQILITTKRFENEFTKKKLAIYTSEYKLEDFTPRNYKGGFKKKNLLYDIVVEFNNNIKALRHKTSSTNEIFKTIEELHSYRTGYVLQIMSLFIACLAFIFAFDRAKKILVIVYNLIS
jgi:hypothetical protein